MLRLSKLADYGIVVCTQLAAEPDRVHSASELAAQLRLEAPTVAKVLKRLARVGLVLGFRGVTGGYRIARDPRQISVADVVEAFEGPIGMTECSAHGSACVHESQCGVRGHWRLISRAVDNALRGVSLADMLRPVPRSSRHVPIRLSV